MRGTQNCGLYQKLNKYIKKHMALSLPFLKRDSRKKRAQIIAVDLGSRTTKAVLIERRGEILALTRYALLDAPIFEKKISPELLADHLRSVADALGNTTKFITVAVGLNDALVRQVEKPQNSLVEKGGRHHDNNKKHVKQKT